MGGFYLNVKLYWEGSAPAACVAGLLFIYIYIYICQTVPSFEHNFFFKYFFFYKNNDIDTPWQLSNDLMAKQSGLVWTFF